MKQFLVGSDLVIIYFGHLGGFPGVAVEFLLQVLVLLVLVEGGLVDLGEVEGDGSDGFLLVVQLVVVQVGRDWGGTPKHG